MVSSYNHLMLRVSGFNVHPSQPSSFNAHLTRDLTSKFSAARDDVAAGREYVESYVQLMHFSEELEALTSGHDPAGKDASLPAAHHPL